MTIHCMNSFKLIQKGKVFLVQAIKAYMRRRSTAPLILNFGTRWRWVFISCPGHVPCLPLKRRLGKPQSSLDISWPYQDFNPNHPAQNNSLYQIHCTRFLQIASHHKNSNMPNATCGLSVWHACCTCYNSRFVHPGFDTYDICSHLEVQKEGSIDVN